MAMAGTNDNASRIARSAALTLVISVAVLYLGDRFGMYDLVKMEKSKAANVTTGLYHESDDGNAGFGGSPSG